jgi:hypothetical protein
MTDDRNHNNFISGQCGVPVILKQPLILPSQRKEAMSDPLRKSSALTGFFASARGRLLSALAAVFLVLGIIAEVFSLVTSYYNMRTVQAQSYAATGWAPTFSRPGQATTMSWQERAKIEARIAEIDQELRRRGCSEVDGRLLCPNKKQ